VSSCMTLLVVLSVSYIPGALRFQDLCATHGEPILGEVPAAEGYFIDAYYVWIHSKSEELLKSGVLRYVEGKNNRSKSLPYLRVSFDENGTRIEEQVPALESEYGFRMLHRREHGITSITREFFRIDSGEVLSRYASYDYMGGPLAWLMQPWGRRSCPEYGDEWFDLTYKELPLITFGFESID